MTGMHSTNYEVILGPGNFTLNYKIPMFLSALFIVTAKHKAY